jgi:nicotinate-nucleotide adenylyltransferase
MEVARAVARNFELDRLLIIPAHRPPHKDPDAVSDAYHRYAMAVLASAGDPRLMVSTIELEKPDKPYTFETVERLERLYAPHTRHFLIIGADSFAEIDTWREPERLLSSTNLIVAARPGVEISTTHLSASARARVRDLRRFRSEATGGGQQEEEGFFIYLTGYVMSDISSTEIRRRVRQGESIEGMVPSSVVDYIEKYGLYR